MEQIHEYREKVRDTVDQILGYRRRAETQLIRYMGTEKGQRHS